MSIYIICRNVFKDGCDPWILSKFMAKPLTDKGPEYLETDDYNKANQICWSCRNFAPKPGQYNLSCDLIPNIQENGVHISTKNDYKAYVKDLAEKHSVDCYQIEPNYITYIIDE